MQPLRGEVRDERPGARIGEHAAHLPLENHRLVQLARDRHIQQLVVRDAAPQEERQARGEIQVAHAIDGTGSRAGGILFDAEEEMRAHQHGGERHLDAGVEVAIGTGLPVERERPLQIRVRDRTPIRPPHQRRKD